MKSLLIALAVLTAPTDSLPDLSRPWTLDQCIDWAMDHNLTVAGSEITLETRKVDDNTARMSWLPSVNGSVDESFSFGRGIGGNNTYESGNSSSTSFSVGANMTLFDGLATPRRIQLAKLNLEAATADLEKARNDIRVQVAQGFESGADAYLMKPFSARVLKVRMRKLIEKAEATRKDMGTNWLVGNDKSTTSAQDAFLSEIKSYIEKNLTGDINIQDLINSLGMSKSKFYRKLGEITDYSPSDIINLIRIRLALNLMLTKNKNISEAAAATGFSSTSYFCRVFQKYYKESPGEWMKRNTSSAA